MNKYKVKNCPAISFAGGCQNGKVKVWDYQDCTDCVMKQIVELCKPLNTKQPESYYNLEILLAKRILQLLDIQEV